jgi:hypothetical protein
MCRREGQLKGTCATGEKWFAVIDSGAAEECKNDLKCKGIESKAMFEMIRIFM